MKDDIIVNYPRQTCFCRCLLSTLPAALMANRKTHPTVPILRQIFLGKEWREKQGTPLQQRIGCLRATFWWKAKSGEQRQKLHDWAIRLNSSILQIGHLSNESKCKSQIRAHFEINTLRSRRHLTKWMLEHQQSVDETLANSRPVPPIRRAKSADGKRKSAVVKSKIHLCIHGSWKTIMITRRDILYTFIYIYSAMRKSKY